MRKLIVLLLFTAVLSDISARQLFQLAPPLVQFRSGYFSDSASVHIRYNQPGAAIHYTFEDRDPVASDPQYADPIIVNRACTLKLKAIGEGYLPSETISLPFHKTGIKIGSVSTSDPNSFYAQLGSAILHDDVGGIANYRSGTWLGFDSDTVWIDLNWDKPVTFHTVELSLLQDEGSWIFLPRRIEIWTKEEASGKWHRVQEKETAHDKPGTKRVALQQLNWEKPGPVRALRIMLLTVGRIPDWHTAKGERGWTFVDEVIVR